jgi:hypothetical protein
MAKHKLSKGKGSVGRRQEKRNKRFAPGATGGAKANVLRDDIGDDEGAGGLKKRARAPSAGGGASATGASPAKRYKQGTFARPAPAAVGAGGAKRPGASGPRAGGGGSGGGGSGGGAAAPLSKKDLKAQVEARKAVRKPNAALIQARAAAAAACALACTHACAQPPAACAGLVHLRRAAALTPRVRAHPAPRAGSDDDVGEAAAAEPDQRRALAPHGTSPQPHAASLPLAAF